MTDRDAPPAGASPPPGPASRLGIFVIAAVLIVDQLSKILADQLLTPGVPINVLPILQLSLDTNSGIAFSFFRGSSTAVVLGAVTLVTVLILIFWSRAKEGGRIAAVGFGFIVGGAVGNIVDRVLNGHVTDFLLLHIGDRSFFIFNLADFALTIGAIVLIIAYILPPAKRTPRFG